MSWFLSLFKSKPVLNPENYGWKLLQKHGELLHYEIKGVNCNFYLYNGFGDRKNKWIFDKNNKTGPGVLDKFNGPLLEEDFLYMNEVIKK